MSITISVKFEEKFQEMLDKIAGAIEESVDLTLHKVANNVRLNAPVRTGALRASVSVYSTLTNEFPANTVDATLRNPRARIAQLEGKPSAFKGFVLVPVHYASYIEFGSPTTAAHFMFRNSQIYGRQLGSEVAKKLRIRLR